MIIHDVRQNTPEWRALRAGLPTASQFFRIITPTGKKSSQREGYLFQLLGECILGYPKEDVKFNWAMERGSALEAKAVEYFEFQTDMKTEACGFITDNDERYGASPDRLIGEHGILECKAPEFTTHLQYLMTEGSAYADYRTQAQGELWVSERDYVWFLSFHPDLPWSLQMVERDEAFIEKMAAEVYNFCSELEALKRHASEKGWFRRDSIRQPRSQQDELIKAMKESLIAVKK